MSEHSNIIRLVLLNFRCGRWHSNFTITNFLLLLGAFIQVTCFVYQLDS